MQVLSGSQYVARAQANQYRTVRVQAPRGPILDRYGNVLVTNQPVTSVELWWADLPKPYAKRVAELRALARVTRVPLYEIAAMIKHGSRGDLLTPIVIRDEAPRPMVTYLDERADEFPGVVLAPNYVRHYPNGSLAAQLLGNVGEIDQNELRTLAARGYQSGDEIGQAGVEGSSTRICAGSPAPDGFASTRSDGRSAAARSSRRRKRARPCG